MGYGEGGYGEGGYGGSVTLLAPAPALPARLLPESVIWQRPSPAVDRYGNATADWSAPVSSTLRVRIEQAAASDRDGQTGLAAFGVWRLFTNELSIESGHRIVRGSVTFEVDGPPHVVYDALGPHHVEARLTTAQT